MIRVYLGTTEGPVQVERITREPDASQSAVCHKRSANVFMALSAGYDAFVKPLTGVIERELGPFGAGAFRLDVSDAVGDGDSWQLGVFVAHGLAAGRRLAGPDDPYEAAIWCTGEVDNDLNAGAVDHVAEKLRTSLSEFQRLADQGTRVTVILPHANRADADAVELPPGVDLAGVTSAVEACAAVAVAVPGRAATGGPARKRWVLAAAAAAICVAAAAFAYIQLRPDSAPPMAIVELPIGKTVTKTPNPVSSTGKQPVETPRDLKLRPNPAENTVVKAIVAPSTVTLEIQELRPPPGKTCPAVHFGTAQPVTIPVPAPAGSSVTTRRGGDLCGLQFVVTARGPPFHAALDLMVTEGRYIEAGQRPPALGGAVAFSGQRIWRIHLPQGRQRRFAYRMSLLADAKPVAGKVPTAASDADWDDRVKQLQKRLLTVFTVRHLVIP